MAAYCAAAPNIVVDPNQLPLPWLHLELLPRQWRKVKLTRQGWEWIDRKFRVVITTLPPIRRQRYEMLPHIQWNVFSSPRIHFTAEVKHKCLETNSKQTSSQCSRHCCKSDEKVNENAIFGVYYYKWMWLGWHNVRDSYDTLINQNLSSKWPVMGTN